MFQVYTIKNKLNGNIYVGCTEVGLELRFERHIKSMNKGSDCSLHQAIREFGKDNFEIKMIEEYSTKEEMFKGEIKYIKELDTYKTPYGYNDTKGGEGGDTNGGKTFDNEWRSNLSKSMAGRPLLSHRKWPAEVEKEICRLYVEEKKSRYWIADKYGCYRSLITEILYRNDVEVRTQKNTNGRNRFSFEQEEIICQEYLNGNISRSSLAKKYKCGTTTMRDILLRHDVDLSVIPTRSKEPFIVNEDKMQEILKAIDKYEIKNIKRFTFEEAEQIRLEFKKGGVSQKELANKYGIAQTTISSIVRNRSYTK
jgi:group I intron endonuclease